MILRKINSLIFSAVFGKVIVLITIRKSKRGLDENMNVGVIFIDPSKAFATLNVSLLLAKFKADGLSPTALKQMESYLTSNNQRTKVAGVPQESILGPFLFNIFLNDLFSYPEETYLSNYTDDNTLQYTIHNTYIWMKFINHSATILESFKI